MSDFCEAIMGNVWKKLAKGAKEPGCPRTLEELLSDFDDADRTGDADVRIASNHWSKRFRRFLEDRQLEDEVVALRFLVHLQPHLAALKMAASASTAENNNDKKGSRDLKACFESAAELFFSEKSESPLVVSNPKLAEAVLEAAAAPAETASSPSSASLSPELASLLLRARSDPDVWQNGLEPRFFSFAEREGKISAPVACLLSIM